MKAVFTLLFCLFSQCNALQMKLESKDDYCINVKPAFNGAKVTVNYVITGSDVD